MAKRNDLRAGEIALSDDPAGIRDASIAFIGQVRSPWNEDNCPKNIRQARERKAGGRLELKEPYRPGLTGLREGQAIQVLFWADRKSRDIILQTPGHAEGPRGVFALRSPVRPNSIALSTVIIKTIDIEKGVVEVDAIDCFDKTPLIDIKPWIETVDPPPL